MNARLLMFLMLVVAHGLSIQAQPLDFSIDRFSPESWSPADILFWDGSAVKIPASRLGLAATDEVDAFSYGDDEIDVVSDYYFVRVAYSVARGALGNGGAVQNQAAGNGAAGDKFQIAAVSIRGQFFATPSQLVSDAPRHGLTPNDVSELDGLALNRLGTTNFPVYFSVTNGHPIWSGADILMIRTNGAAPEIFATAAQLGLTLADDIDALAIGSVPIAPPPLQLGPNVVVWVSLVNGSPSRVPVGLAFIDGVMQVFPGPHAVALDATAFDLAPGDDLDALTGLDPGMMVHESARSGPAGQTNEGYTVSASQMLGWRFHVREPLLVTAVGGHLNGGGGTIFGAIVRLSGPDALPGDGAFNPDSLVGQVTFEPSMPSGDVRAPLLAQLSPGYYALVFGSGLFGADGAAMMPANDEDIPGKNSYVTLQGSGWQEAAFRNVRFVVEGLVPRLAAQHSAGAITLEWHIPAFVLESSRSLNGPFEQIADAESPYTLPMSGPAKFFRLRAAEFGICYEGRGCVVGNEIAFSVEKQSCQAISGGSWKGGTSGCINF